jgi:hypothetical protein
VVHHVAGDDAAYNDDYSDWGHISINPYSAGPKDGAAQSRSGGPPFAKTWLIGAKAGIYSSDYLFGGIFKKDK